jgi:hypothetical protein
MASAGPLALEGYTQCASALMPHNISCSHLTALGLGNKKARRPTCERDEDMDALVRALYYIPQLRKLHFTSLAGSATDAGLQCRAPKKCMTQSAGHVSMYTVIEQMC